MRIAPFLLVAAFVFLGVPTSVHADPDCTSTGTLGSDDLNGTPVRDVLCARAGKDYGNGRAASDIVRGGLGNDTLVGGSGADTLLGKPGNDQLFATDGGPGDDLDGGRGFDRCYGDRGDHMIDCEHRVRI